MTPEKKTEQNTRQNTGRKISHNRTRNASKSASKHVLKKASSRGSRKTPRQTQRRQSTTSKKMIHRTSTATPRGGKQEPIPEIKDGVRSIPLGGVEEVGRNMTLVETPEDIVIVDAGFQFVTEDNPGVDYILPNTKYLEDRKHKIRALLITHGHLDHIGGIPFILDRIGNPPIYTGELTSIMIKRRAEEFVGVVHDVHVLNPDVPLTLGKLKVKTFPVTHSIPDSTGMIIETKYTTTVSPLLRK